MSARGRARPWWSECRRGACLGHGEPVPECLGGDYIRGVCPFCGEVLVEALLAVDADAHDMLFGYPVIIADPFR